MGFVTAFWKTMHCWQTEQDGDAHGGAVWVTVALDDIS